MTYDENDAAQYEYHLKDHLGNVRIAFADKDGDGYIEPFSVNPNEPNGGGDGATWNLTETEILQESHYYPFGMTMDGAWQDIVNGAENNYLYNGKELQTDFDLNWLDYGLRYYDPAIARWGQVDPLADQRVWVSPYNYVQNNPLLRIDPTGALDNTIFLDEEGNKLHETEDDFDDAIVVISNDKKQDFEQYRNQAKKHGESDIEVEAMRSMGDKYMVDGMNAVWDKSMETTLPAGIDGFVDKNGNPATDVHPEAGSYFNVSEDGNTLIVDPDIFVSESTDNVQLGGDRPAIHSHPVNGNLYKKVGGTVTGPAREPEDPSPRDHRNSVGRQERAPSRYRDVVVGPKNIYLYKGSKSVGTVPRSFFNK